MKVYQKFIDGGLAALRCDIVKVVLVSGNGREKGKKVGFF